MRRLAPVLLALLFGAELGPGTAAAAPPAPALAEVQIDALPDVKRRIDHFAIDPAGQRLFVSALGNHTLEVIDLAAGTRMTSLSGLDEPQGVAYLPSFHRIVVAMRAGGRVTAFDDHSYQPVATMTGMGDADNLRYDAAAQLLYLGHGEGALEVIEPANMKSVASIPLPGHPESFQLETAGARVFVNMPPTHEILAVDRVRRSVVKHISLGRLADNYPMSLDERGHRLFVVVRTPAQLLVFDTDSYERVAAVPCVGDSDDLFYDARRDRVYVIGGQGDVDVFDASPGAHYARLQRLATRAGARTGIWSNELDRLFVAFPQRNDRPAEIDVFRPPSAP